MKIFSAFTLMCLLFAWSALPAGAIQSDFPISSTAASEMNLGLGARPAALGEAFVGLADDFNATAWNPAGLSQVKGYQAGFLHSLYFESISMEYLAYAQNVAPGAGLGATFTYFNYGTLDKVEDVNGAPVPDGQFSPSAIALAVAYGQKLSTEFSLGGTIKFFDQSIDNKTYTVLGLDLAALYQPEADLQFGLALQNLGTPLAGYSLPVNIKFGAVYKVALERTQDAWNILADFNVPAGDAAYRSISLGTEYVYNRMLAGRLGYNLKNTGDIGGANGLCLGLGVKLAGFCLDYALVSFGDLGLTHQIMLSTDFSFAAAPAPLPSPLAKPVQVVVEKPVFVYRVNPEDAKNKDKIRELEAQKRALEKELAEFKKDIAIGILKPILFENDKSTLLSSAYDALDYLAKILSNYPELIVRVEGHTDDVGTAAHNLTLSQQRAETVCKYLTSKAPALDADHLIPIGYGKTRPLVKSKNNTARAKNRRVEFKVINPYKNSVK